MLDDLCLRKDKKLFKDLKETNSKSYTMVIEGQKKKLSIKNLQLLKKSKDKSSLLRKNSNEKRLNQGFSQNNILDKKQLKNLSKKHHFIQKNVNCESSPAPHSGTSQELTIKKKISDFARKDKPMSIILNQQFNNQLNHIHKNTKISNKPSKNNNDFIKKQYYQKQSYNKDNLL